MDKRSDFFDGLLLEEEVGSGFRELLADEFVELKVEIQAQMISQLTILRYFLIQEMGLIINLFHHAQNCPDHQIKRLNMNTIAD
jgi:hypothetical protein